MTHHSMNRKKHLWGGAFAPKTKREKSISWNKKYLVKFLEIFFAHLMRNIFLILKWSHFLSFGQNWPISEGLQFLLLKIDNFPFSGVSATVTP